MSGMVGPTAAGEPGESQTRVVRMQDDCDPATFNAAVGEGTCVGDGGTTFEEFVESLTEDREAGGWSFSPDRLTVDRGAGLRALNRGGEVHSFTRVRRFGPGCVPEINEILGFPAGATVAECGSPRWLRTLRAPGESLRVRELSAGTHRFECLIHPWMRTTVRVRANQH